MKTEAEAYAKGILEKVRMFVAEKLLNAPKLPGWVKTGNVSNGVTSDTAVIF